MAASWRQPLVTRRLAAGAVIAHPAEGVWGLACDGHSESAALRILALKKRSPRQGLILVADTSRLFEPWLQPLSDAQRQALEETWPGPVTWLLPHLDLLPRWIVGEHATVALRVTAFAPFQQLIRALGRPLISTSANVSGRPAATTAAQVRRYFGARIDALVPGSTGGLPGPTEIRRLDDGAILRPAGHCG